MEFSVAEIADIINGEVEGDDSIPIQYVNKIENAQPGGISFLANPKYEQALYSSRASAFIVNKDPEGNSSQWFQLLLPCMFHNVLHLH